MRYFGAGKEEDFHNIVQVAGSKKYYCFAVI